MKCHFTYVEGMKVWIPGCYSGIYTEGFCACRINEKERLKRVRENDPEYKARIENIKLWDENAKLHRVIDALIKRTKQE